MLGGKKKPARNSFGWVIGVTMVKVQMGPEKKRAGKSFVYE